MHRKLLVIGAAVVGVGAVALGTIPVDGGLQAGAEALPAEAHVRPTPRGSFGDQLGGVGFVVAMDNYIKAIDTAKAVEYIDALKVAEYAAAVARTQASHRVRSGGGGSRCGSDFECFKACTTSRESHGNYAVVSNSGTYRGAWQFDQRTWESNGGTGDPAAATPAQQDAVAQATWQRRGNQPWGGMC